MKKIVLSLTIMTALAGSFAEFALVRKAFAGVNVEVNIGAPVIESDAPGEVVFMPGSGVYFVPDARYEIFYYGDFWWSRRGSRWYRSRNYRGGWAVASGRDVPAPLHRIPGDYRQRFVQERHIKYGDWKGHRSQERPQERGSWSNNNTGERQKEQGNQNSGQQGKQNDKKHSSENIGGSWGQRQ